jgi:nucleotide-binding universal stress UspA family protein
MMWKDILVFADGSDSGVARALCARTIATHCEADLALCVLVDMVSTSIGGVTPGVADIHEQIRREARDDAGRLLQAVEADRGGALSRCSVSVVETPRGDAVRLAASLARSSDLVVCAQPIDGDATSIDEAILGGAVMQSGRPCLVLPRRPAWPMIGERILVTWNGSREASRAAHDALPLLRRAKAVAVMMSGPGERIDGTDNGGLLRVCTHLAHHGVRIEGPETMSLSRHASEDILSVADGYGADMIVMGAFGSSPTFERIAGGVTHSTLRGSRIGLFLSH